MHAFFNILIYELTLTC